MRSKYRNVITEVDGVKFSSRKEAARYQDLKLLSKAGEVKWFLMQAPFRLPGNVKYLCDFLVVWADGKITVEDVKGFKKEKVYLLKKKQVEEIYKIKIEEK